MPERVLLHDWFFTFQLLEDTWTVVAWGRGHASSSSSRAPLRPHTVAKRISLEQFVRGDGTLVELAGPCDVARARQAGEPHFKQSSCRDASRRAYALNSPIGVPEPVTTGFSKGVPPAWNLLLGLANSIYALATLPLALLPPGSSRPPSPALPPQLLPADVDSDDEALPETLFDLGTGYKRPEGAPSTIKQLAAVLDLRKEPEFDEEEPLRRRDRDAGYDEDAEEVEEAKSMEEARLDRANGASQVGMDGSTALEEDHDRAASPAHLDRLPSSADPDENLKPSTTSARIASSPPHDSSPPLSSPEKLPPATENPAPALPICPLVDGASTTFDDSALPPQDAQPLHHLPSPHAATPPPDARITATFPTPSALARDEQPPSTVLHAEQTSSTDLSVEAGIEDEGAGAVTYASTVEPLDVGAAQVVEERSDELGGSSKDEDPQVDAVMSEAIVEHETVEQEDDKEEIEVVLDMPQHPMSFHDTLEAFVATSPGACESDVSRCFSGGRVLTFGSHSGQPRALPRALPRPIIYFPRSSLSRFARRTLRLRFQTQRRPVSNAHTGARVIVHR